MKVLLRTLCLVLTLFVVSNAYADADNLVLITKTTRLTGVDAVGFARTFGRAFRGDDTFNYVCKTDGKATGKRDNDTCVINATVGHLSGKMAASLLRNNDSLRFSSKNRMFTFSCKNTLNCQASTEKFCYISQKMAHLAK